ncbi:hypothetical protein T10_7039, partial [Trichinella papuae]
MGELDDKLSKFVKDTISFKGSLRENHAVMAGEFARSYMIGRESPNRLEIITSQVGKELGYQARKIIDTLCDGEGYIYLNGEASQGEDYEVHKCRRVDGNVVLIYSFHRGLVHDPLSDVLSMAHGLHLGCVISWNKVYCAYPWGVSVDSQLVRTSSFGAAQRRELRSWFDEHFPQSSPSVCFATRTGEQHWWSFLHV